MVPSGLCCAFNPLCTNGFFRLVQYNRTGMVSIIDPLLVSYKTGGHVYIQLLGAERHAPCQRNLATDQDEPAALAAQ